MKQTLLFTLLLIALLPGAAMAQADDVTHVSVRAGGTALKDLLTDEQKAGVTYLTVTGTLQEDDYAFLREELFKQLKELNLRDADIDTIPAHAFEVSFDYSREIPDKRIILPKTLKHLADNSLAISKCRAVAILTGTFPTLGKNVYNAATFMPQELRIRIEPSEDNTAYKLVGNGLYSADGSVLYYYGSSFFSSDNEILYGTRIIAANAFENVTKRSHNDGIPETVDSIGDRAFANMTKEIALNGRDYFDFKCHAKVPPKLGKDVFCYEKTGGWPEIKSFYVPDESVALYKAAEGWKDFDIREMSNSDGIETLRTDGHDLSASDNGSCYVLSAQKDIIRVSGYDADGKRISSVEVSGNEANIAKSSLAYPFTLVRVDYKDGTMVTVKLRP